MEGSNESTGDTNWPIGGSNESFKPTQGFIRPICNSNGQQFALMNKGGLFVVQVDLKEASWPY